MKDVNLKQIQLIHQPLQRKKYNCGFYAQVGTSEAQMIHMCKYILNVHRQIFLE